MPLVRTVIGHVESVTEHGSLSLGPARPVLASSLHIDAKVVKHGHSTR